MIPKIIHYCWFGGKKKNDEVKSCIDSWHSMCSDYEIIEWNETNFDINTVPYVKEAYQQKKWAFVSDYVRLYALEKYGGIYLDTDVEIIKSLNSFLQNKTFFGAESKYSICTAVIGAEKNASFVDELLTMYNGIHFINQQDMDLTPNSQRIYKYLEKNYSYKCSEKVVNLDNCTIYPKDYFSPINCYTYKKEITVNTHCIHWFAGTWKNKNEIFINKAKAIVTRIIGEDCRNMLKMKLEAKEKNK